MNLVAKEYLACKTDGKGVLVLSEMAGASKELIGALQVNPNNVEGIADALNQALQMPEKEQIERVRKMQKVLRRNDIYYWSKHFLERLNEVHKASRAIYDKHFDVNNEKKLLTTFKKGKKRILFLDYDGTLANFRSDPLIASPTKKVYQILTSLTENKKNKVVIISGRDKETLGKWFGKMSMDIVAEHGAWFKSGNESDWSMFSKLKNDWKEELRPIFNQFTLRTPGSFLEEKNFSLAWHYRKTDPGLAEMRQHEFMDKLSQAIAGKNLQIMEGNKVLEVKNEEINKGTAAKNWLNEKWDFIMAVGDDYTDEDTFIAMPEEAFTLKVGYHDTAAKSNIPAVEDVVNLLEKMTKNQ
jgi:trehalose 6-phosphate synthase/phosphatase